MGGHPRSRGTHPTISQTFMGSIAGYFTYSFIPPDRSGMVPPWRLSFLKRAGH